MAQNKIRSKKAANDPDSVVPGIEKFATEISKTGFVLENWVASRLKKEGWTVISNKYYEDDVEGSVREVDLLAYKVREVQRVDIYTTLIISCKKSESHTWALLARDIDLKNKNYDWWPIHAWTNYKPLAHQLSLLKASENYHKEISALGVIQVLSVPKFEIFAFQEMKSSSGVPDNDKNIYSSLTSLVKAQAYELSSLHQRKKNKQSIYQFNLLTVADADLVRLEFDQANSIEACSTDLEHFISRYIVNKKESFSRVLFVKSHKFPDILQDYNRLHDANCKWVDNSIQRFFDNIFLSPTRTEVLIEAFRDRLKPNLPWLVRRAAGQTLDLQSIRLSYEGKRVTVGLPFEQEYVDILNHHRSILDEIQTALSDVYRYTGEFTLVVDDIPF